MKVYLMTAEMLRSIQEEIKFDAPSMAASLGVTIRAYRNYLYGANAIPDVVDRNALELLHINREFIRTAPARIDARIDREFPHGILSEVSKWD
jgi:hypothetical protein